MNVIFSILLLYSLDCTIVLLWCFDYILKLKEEIMNLGDLRNVEDN